MVKFILFNDYPSFDPSSLYFGEKITYQSTPHTEQDFYIVTPEFTILDIEEQSDTVHMSVLFGDSSFLETITVIDNLCIQDYSNKSGSKTRHIMRNFVPSLVMDSISAKQNVMEFAIPVINSKPLVKVYDNEATPVSLSSVEVGYKGKAILQPEGIKFDQAKGVYNMIWKVDQLKIKIPEVCFNECVLDDDSDNVEIL